MNECYHNERKKFSWKETAFFIAGAIAVNLILFSLIPNLIAKGVSQADLKKLPSVNIMKLIEPEIEPEPVKPPEPEKEPELQPVKKPELSKPLMTKLQLDMPEISFDINPRLENTIPVVKLNRPFSEGELDTLPMPTFKSAPVYPYRAKRLNVSGRVKVTFLVDKNGTIKNIQILEAIPEGFFEQSVLKALSTWRYSPGELTGEKVDSIVTTTIVFNLEN